MNLREAIKIHNELCDKEEIIKYQEATHIILSKINECNPKKEYYKSSNIRDYYIELPYRKLTFKNGKVVFEKHYYNITSTYKKTKSSGNYCLSLCKYNREEIERIIDKLILEDNEKR